VLKLVLFIVPLGLDTFAISAALGAGGLPKRDRLRISLLFSSFEMAMPLVGLLVGRGIGQALGGVADYIAVGALMPLGIWLIADRDGDEGGRVARVATSGVLALVALGLSISLDELAIGFTIGLLRLSLWLAVILIGAQAFLVAQLGLRLGSRLKKKMREASERLAGVALLGIAAWLLVEKLT
jgi:manganese efflux pump family protein